MYPRHSDGINCLSSRPIRELPRFTRHRASARSSATKRAKPARDDSPAPSPARVDLAKRSAQLVATQNTDRSRTHSPRARSSTIDPCTSPRRHDRARSVDIRRRADVRALAIRHSAQPLEQQPIVLVVERLTRQIARVRSTACCAPRDAPPSASTRGRSRRRTVGRPLERRESIAPWPARSPRTCRTPRARPRSAISAMPASPRSMTAMPCAAKSGRSSRSFPALRVASSTARATSRSTRERALLRRVELAEALRPRDRAVRPARRDRTCRAHRSPAPRRTRPRCSSQHSYRRRRGRPPRSRDRAAASSDRHRR